MSITNCVMGVSFKFSTRLQLTRLKTINYKSGVVSKYCQPCFEITNRAGYANDRSCIPSSS